MNLNLTEKIFFESLKWHNGKPPYFEEPTNSQVAFHGTIFAEKVVAVKDTDGNMFIVGYFNRNLCMGICQDCNGELEKSIPCAILNDIVEWAEFY